MELSSLASAVSSAQAAQTGAAVSLKVLDKAMELSAQSALALIQAIPLPASNPANLGNGVDIRV
ncbi:MAG: YjfB family protein [Pseudomonas sp.]|uniref:YjfB family protein n=1 Tax=Pseudomonas sp. TaxID=306 RepID=UPI0033983923